MSSSISELLGDEISDFQQHVKVYLLVIHRLIARRGNHEI